MAGFFFICHQLNHRNDRNEFEPSFRVIDFYLGNWYWNDFFLHFLVIWHIRMIKRCKIKFFVIFYPFHNGNDRNDFLISFQISDGMDRKWSEWPQIDFEWDQKVLWERAIIPSFQSHSVIPTPIEWERTTWSMRNEEWEREKVE